MAESMGLELRADKTFSMTMMMMPLEGTYEVSGDTLILTPTKMMGVAKGAFKPSASRPEAPPKEEEQIRMRISEGGRVLTPIRNGPRVAAANLEYVREK